MQQATESTRRSPLRPLLLAAATVAAAAALSFFGASSSASADDGHSPGALGGLVSTLTDTVNDAVSRVDALAPAPLAPVTSAVSTATTHVASAVTQTVDTTTTTVVDAVDSPALTASLDLVNNGVLAPVNDHVVEPVIDRVVEPTADTILEPVGSVLDPVGDIIDTVVGGISDDAVGGAIVDGDATISESVSGAATDAVLAPLAFTHRAEAVVAEVAGTESAVPPLRGAPVVPGDGPPALPAAPASSGSSSSAGHDGPRVIAVASDDGPSAPVLLVGSAVAVNDALPATPSYDSDSSPD